MSRWVLIPAALVCLVAAVPFARFLTREHELVAATPSPRAMFEVTYVGLSPGRRLCLSDVTIPSDARRLRVQVRTYGRPGPPLDIALRARGYEQRLAVAGGYPDETVLTVPMEPPRGARLGEVCLSQRGEDAIALVGTSEDRTRSRPKGTIDGREEPADTYLAFYEDGAGSPLRETAAIVERMGAFKPGIVGPWLLWPLLILTMVGVPCGIVWAALRSVQT